MESGKAQISAVKERMIGLSITSTKHVVVKTVCLGCSKDPIESSDSKPLPPNLFRYQLFKGISTALLKIQIFRKYRFFISHMLDDLSRGGAYY